MKIKKLALVLGLVISVIGMSAACGASTESDTTQKGEDSKVELRFAMWDDADKLSGQQARVDEFNASQDKINVTLEAYGSDYSTKITAGMGAGDAPDVMYMWNYPAFSKGLEPLDTYIEAEGSEYKENFYEALWPYNSIDGVTYGIPVSEVTLCLYYNKDLFDQAGVPYPTADWTWQDMEKASVAIQEKIDNVYGYTFPMARSTYQVEMFLWSNGAAYVDENGELDGNINSPEAIEVFDMFQEMTKKGNIYASENKVQDDFLAGKAAMGVDGTWRVGKFKEEGLNFGIVTMPKFEGKDKAISVLHTSGLAMSKDSEYKDEAWEFIKFWTGEEMNKERIGTELPALKSVVESENLLEDEFYAPFYEALDQSSGYIPASFIVENWSEIDAEILLAIESIYNPSVYADPKTLLDQIAETY